ncbi:2-oxoglutarate-Fe(II) type oxidoreductase ppzC [Fulvia fulva]|uniref:2-oxoglutarate-Fe(II) type oxidoreductase ppzC n=1 Tax=Passalora fulva TaxID=5499 RepID=A0A9Q8P4U2_PASFU|nr:2-oxoglutarate-Fe(II) type oxidoreductase ppzC [Fulvia fulva]UJO13214.1 2-oxoglutarate-Fe(II) type oxidoreductase ppzC [Fulvia fulva]
MTAATIAQPSVHKLELRTALGPVYRDALDTPPRDCTNDEIPIIDLSPIFADALDDRLAVAKQIKWASTTPGFFYIENHGIEAQTIDNARKALLSFFHQRHEDKMKVHKSHFKSSINGYSPARTTLINKADKIDNREAFSWQYLPKYDPDSKPLDDIPKEVKPYIYGEDAIWDCTAHLEGFKEATLEYWSACLTLARHLVRTFALALELPEDYFDSRVTYPGADGVYNYYPPSTAQDLEDNTCGLGSHTDLQLFTLLWQDAHGGLQVLKPGNLSTDPYQWIKAVPVPDTIVVNIGDFLMRLSNDTFKSTVHRVYNKTGKEQVSMPFFFGLNFNCVEGVIPSCVNEQNSARYEPISCGDWCQLRFKQESVDFAKAKDASAGAPSGKVVAT